ncbi:MAG: twin-arginine translocation signal domain-containing protein, partial [Alphaproteobacteria bacterium]
MGDPMRTNKDSEKAPVKRRDFLKLAGLGGVAVGAAAAGAPRTA